MGAFAGRACIRTMCDCKTWPEFSAPSAHHAAPNNVGYPVRLPNQFSPQPYVLPKSYQVPIADSAEKPYECFD